LAHELREQTAKRQKVKLPAHFECRAFLLVKNANNLSVQADARYRVVPVAGLGFKQNVELAIIRHLDLKLGGSFRACGHKNVGHRECAMGNAVCVQIEKPFNDLTCKFLHSVRLQRKVALKFTQQDALRLAREVASFRMDLKSQDWANVGVLGLT
jgi:hypothetical protein